MFYVGEEFTLERRVTNLHVAIRMPEKVRSRLWYVMTLKMRRVILAVRALMFLTSASILLQREKTYRLPTTKTAETPSFRFLDI